MTKLPEITRVVPIEHAGETINLEVHIHLSREEIRTILAPAVLDALGAQARPSASVRLGVANSTTGEGLYGVPQ